MQISYNVVFIGSSKQEWCPVCIECELPTDWRFCL
nr:MAG TPA: TniQ [Bacteriophage sp.]